MSDVFFLSPGERREEHTDLKHYIVRWIETQNRLILQDDLGIKTTSWTSMQDSLERVLDSEDQRPFLIFLECVVKYVRDVFSDRDITIRGIQRESDKFLAFLDLYLSRGSRWSVVFETGAESGLIERADEHLLSIAKQLESDPLTRAWNEAFGLKPNPEKAIEDSQLAIEGIASEYGLVSTTTSVYGNLIGLLKTNPSRFTSAGKSSFDLSNRILNDKKNPVDYNEKFVEWVQLGLELIQKAHPARHASKATKNYTVPIDAARQSVLIATLVCELLRQGYFGLEQANVV